MIAPQIELMARAGATALADSIAVGAGVAIVACVLNALFRQRSAATRSRVLLAALVATAALPLLRLSLHESAIAVGSASLLHVAEAWAPWILVTWAVAAAIGIARIIAGVLNLRRLRQSCRRVADGTVDGELVRAHCPSRNVELLVSTEAAVPAAIGWFQPAVVLPEWVLNEMPADELRQVIIHELSHLSRWDDWTNLVQQVVKAVLFFHPAVWWMEARLSLEREMACDDAVLKRSENARSYAECLARIAERSFLRRGLSMAQAAVSRVRQTSHRVARILQFDKNLAVRTGRPSFALAMIVTVAGMGLAWRAPLLFSFGTNQPQITAIASTPDLPTPSLQPVKAAWHEAAPLLKHKPQALPLAHKTMVATRRIPETDERALPASFTTRERGTMRSVVFVVMQDGEPVAIWHITTWEYSPSREVRSARKTT